MFESLLALGIFVSFFALAAIPALPLMQGGAAVAGVSLLLGLVATSGYHFKLWNALDAQIRTPRQFWMRPMSYHKDLSDADRPQVLRWFAVGVATFIGSVAGGFAALVGLIRYLW